MIKKIKKAFWSWLYKGAKIQMSLTKDNLYATDKVILSDNKIIIEAQGEVVIDLWIEWEKK